MQIRNPNDGKWYSVRDEKCMGMECLRLYDVYVRGSWNMGTRSAPTLAEECAIRFHYGCPPGGGGLTGGESFQYDAEEDRQRRQEGYKVRK